MSLSISYSVPNTRRPIESNYSSDFIERLEKVFPKLQFKEESLQKLDDLHILTGDEFYKEIFDLVLQYKHIILHKEY